MSKLKIAELFYSIQGEGRYMGVPFSEITGYDEFVDKMKKEHGDLDGSGQGESELKPFMKKYDSYI